MVFIHKLVYSVPCQGEVEREQCQNVELVGFELVTVVLIIQIADDIQNSRNGPK